MPVFSNDTELLTALKQNIPGAFDQVYETYYLPLCYFAEKISGNQETAQDLVAESFIKLLKKRADFENVTALRSFLYTVTKNACYDYLKMQHRHQASHKEISRMVDIEESAVDLFIIKTDVLRAIYAAIEQLPAKYRDILQLSFIEGKKADEIAETLSIAHQTVKNRKAEGLRLLRTALLKNDGLSPAILSYCLIHIM